MIRYSVGKLRDGLYFRSKTSSNFRITCDDISYLRSGSVRVLHKNFCLCVMEAYHG